MREIAQKNAGLLFINACPRGEDSRTLWLCRAFLSALDARSSVREVRPKLLPLDGETLARREALIDARAWDDPMFDAARAFLEADALLIGAPYWDLSFPASLKAYIEHVFVREMTFRYRDDQPIGLCRARRALFITTAGSPIGADDWGAGYLRAVCRMLGIPRFDALRAEGLDILGADVSAILDKASDEAREIARGWFMYKGNSNSKSFQYR